MLELDAWTEAMKEVIKETWEYKRESKCPEDICPRCGDDKLRGYDDHNLIVCWTCEWSIDKQAWLEAWK